MMNKNKAFTLFLLIAFGLVLIQTKSPQSAQAAEGNIYLPKITRLTLPSTGYVPANPGFEAGETGWVFFYDNGNSIRTNSLAHTGSWSAELGAYYDPTVPEPVAYPRRAFVQQMIYVLPATPVLQFWEYIISDETQCLSFLGDFVSVFVNNSEVARAPLCSPVEGQPVPWAIRQVDLSGYAGRWVYLRIEYNSDSTLPSDYYIDDVALVSKP